MSKNDETFEVIAYGEPQMGTSTYVAPNPDEVRVMLSPGILRIQSALYQVAQAASEAGYWIDRYVRDSYIDMGRYESWMLSDNITRKPGCKPLIHKGSKHRNVKGLK